MAYKVEKLSDDVVLYCGDCLEVMAKMDENSIDAVVTDPPYGVGIAEWDDDMPSNKFIEQCLRIASGSVIFFGSASRILDFANYIPRPDRIIIWSPKFTLSKIAKDGYAYRYHPIAIWRPQKQTTIPWDVLNDATECGNWWEHPGTKPLKLMTKLVNVAGETILDPFMGSGTTGVAAVQLGRKFIGIEIDETYYEIAKKRISQAMLQMRLEI